MNQQVESELVAAAKSMPDLIEAARKSAPSLAEQLEGAPLIYSKTVWGMLVTIVLIWLARHYNLGWDRDTDNLVSGAIVMGVTIGLRWITKTPISSWLRKKI